MLSFPSDHEVHLRMSERALVLSINLFTIKSVKCLFKTDIITHMDVIHEVPIWFNPNLRIDFKKNWFDKGIRTLNDIVDTYGKPMDLQTFQEVYQLKTNFLEYGGFCNKIKSFLRYKDFPHAKTTLPRNSYINIIVSKEKKVYLTYSTV